MSRLVVRAHAIAYWHLRRLFRSFFDDGYDDFKAMTVLGSVQICLLLSIVPAISIIIGRRVVSFSGLPWKAFMVLSVAVIAAANFRYRREWVAYDAHFDRLETGVRRLISVLVGVGALTVVVFTLWIAVTASKLPT